MILFLTNTYISGHRGTEGTERAAPQAESRFFVPTEAVGTQNDEVMVIGGMEVYFTTDELILALVGLIRATDPRLLRNGPSGIQVDFASIEQKQTHTEDERLLLRLRNGLEEIPGEEASEEARMVELSWAEGRRLAEAIERLEKLQPWEPDVIAMGESLRTRLMGLTESAG